MYSTQWTLKIENMFAALYHLFFLLRVNCSGAKLRPGRPCRPTSVFFNSPRIPIRPRVALPSLLSVYSWGKQHAWRVSRLESKSLIAFKDFFSSPLHSLHFSRPMGTSFLSPALLLSLNYLKKILGLWVFELCVLSRGSLVSCVDMTYSGSFLLQFHTISHDEIY